MARIYHTDRKTGIQYVYESESYWDSEKKQPRSRRTIIGKVDPETGEIVPTRKYTRKNKESSVSNEQEFMERIRVLEEQVKKLGEEKKALIQDMQKLLSQYNT